jgi:hypothetical protein
MEKSSSRSCHPPDCLIDAVMLWKISAVLLALSTLLRAADPLPLFNRKNLEGWTFDIIDPEVKPESVWSVADGILICKGRPPGVIRTAKDFSNYELTVEWRWAPGSKPGNSGVLIHASNPREIFVWPKSVEVQLGHGNAGDFWVIGESLTVDGAQPQGRRWWKKGEGSEKPAGEWNVARIRCEGEKITVWVNKVLMNEGIGLSTTKGAICLQSEGGEVHFRKVELTPIAPK